MKKQLLVILILLNISSLKAIEGYGYGANVPGAGAIIPEDANAGYGYGANAPATGGTVYEHHGYDYNEQD